MDTRDITDFAKQLQYFKDTSLHLYALQKEYNDKVGLSGTPLPNGDAIDLPLHPHTLNTELNDYKDYFRKLKSKFIIEETKEKFLRFILQEPPFSVDDEEEQAAVRANEKLKAELKADKQETQHMIQEIKEKNKAIEQSHQALLSDADDLTKILDAMEDDKKELARIEALLKQQSEMTVEQAIAILEQQTESFIDINTQIDERRDRINDYSAISDALAVEVAELEQRFRIVDQEAAEAVQQSEFRDPSVEEMANFYNATTDLCYSLLGIDQVLFASISHLRVVLSGPREEMSVILDPVTGEIQAAHLANNSCDVDDLVKTASSLPQPDALQFLLSETIVRRKSALPIKTTVDI